MIYDERDGQVKRERNVRERDRDRQKDRQTERTTKLKDSRDVTEREGERGEGRKNCV